MLKKAVTPGSFLKNYLFTLLIVFLPLFMFGVFGPSEIFFGNYSEFGFIYREFGWKFLGISVVLALFIALILQIVPKFPRTLILSVLWGFTIAGYIQTMFLNKNLDQIGVSAEGYTANATRVILNALFWLVILAASVLICVFKKDLCTRLLTVTSSILLGIQIVGFVSLFLTADASAMAYNDTDGELSLSGAGQYTLSSNENIILFVLDNFSNTFWDEALASYPDMTDSLSDFTYYNNADCAYWGTVVYFAPYYMFRMKMGPGYRFPAVIIAFVINYAAYFAEIYRSGIESMPNGQYEAAQVLGYNKAQTFIRIILPQVIKRVLPSITNETITLVKDTSLAFTISIAEMFTVAKQIGAAQTSVMPLLAAGIFYYVFNLIVATVMEYIEKRLSYYR